MDLIVIEESNSKVKLPLSDPLAHPPPPKSLEMQVDLLPLEIAIPILRALS